MKRKLSTQKNMTPLCALFPPGGKRKKVLLYSGPFFQYNNPIGTLPGIFSGLPQNHNLRGSYD